MNDFKTQASAWIASSDFLAKAEGMPKIFCVMTHEEEYNMKTEKMSG